METLERETLEFLSEAARYRELWEAASSCLQHNMTKIKPRGQDEKRMLEEAAKSTCGLFWSGKTDGWL
jgi:hypothetical protein